MKKPIFAAMFAIWLIAIVIYVIPISQAQQSLYLTGRVVSGSSHNPVPSVWVEVVKSGNRIRRSLTGDDGRYFISGLDRGSYEIIVVKSMQELFRGQLQLTGNQTFDITL